MTPYLIMLAICMLLAYSYQKYHNRRNIYLYLCILTMSFFEGARKYTVGTDSGSYARSFVFDRKILYGDSWNEIITQEPGFYFLSKFLHLFGNEYWILFLGIGIICSICIILGIKRNTKYLLVSLFFYICLGYYTFGFNAARQGIAASIYFLAYKEIINRNFYKYSLIVLIAALFHKSVIVAIPLYFLFNRDYSWKTIASIVIVTVILSYLIAPILEYSATLESRYRLYSEESKGGGEILTVFNVILSLFFIVQRKYISSQQLDYYDRCLNLSLCGSTIYIFVILTHSYIELTRFAAYFQLSNILLFAEVFSVRKVQLSQLIKSLICVCTLAYFILFTTRMGDFTPYIFNPNFLISWHY